MSRFKPADLALKNGSVWTVDGRSPLAEAIAIRGNEILAVGSAAEIEAATGPQTRVIDLAGRLVLPGFNDAHTHFVEFAARAAMMVDLYGVTSLEALQQRVREHAAAHPAAAWLLGTRWFPSRFEGGAWPSRLELDAVESQRPLAILDVDHHSCWVNSRALQELGYSAQTPDPPGGRLLRDDHGEPTGILFENAYAPIPLDANTSDNEFARLFVQEVAKANRLGLTSLSNHGTKPERLEILERMAQRGELTLRINEWQDLSSDLESARELRQRFSGNEKLRMASLKGFMDGVLSSHTAWMLEPYADAPGETGLAVVDPEELSAWVIEADRQGFQVVIHAVGDQAVRKCLNIYEQAAKIEARERRHRVEHVEVVHPQDQERFASLGVIASMMPLHCTADLEGYIKSRLGEPRGAHGYPWRDFIDRGVHLCFGTDWPAVDLLQPDPLQQIYAAVTRTPAQAQGGPAWHGEQRLTAAEAIRCYTLEAAYAERMEQRKGSLTPGKLADLCVLSRDILKCEPAEILETEVLMTVFEGEVVYRNF